MSRPAWIKALLAYRPPIAKAAVIHELTVKWRLKPFGNYVCKYWYSGLGIVEDDCWLLLLSARSSSVRRGCDYTLLMASVLDITKHHSIALTLANCCPYPLWFDAIRCLISFDTTEEEWQWCLLNCFWWNNGILSYYSKSPWPVFFLSVRKRRCYVTKEVGICAPINANP